MSRANTHAFGFVVSKLGASGWRCPEAEYKPMPDDFAEFIKQQDAEKGHGYFGLGYYHNSKEGVGDGSGTPMWLCAFCREGIADMHAAV